MEREVKPTVEELANVGVELIHSHTMRLRCQRCGEQWIVEECPPSPPKANGKARLYRGKMPCGYWRCPNDCNADHRGRVAAYEEPSLTRAGVDVLDYHGVCLRCMKCGDLWWSFVTPGSGMTAGYWRCTSGCNSAPMSDAEALAIAAARLGDSVPVVPIWSEEVGTA